VINPGTKSENLPEVISKYLVNQEIKVFELLKTVSLSLPEKQNADNADLADLH
jgi:hypothetical protein